MSRLLPLRPHRRLRRRHCLLATAAALWPLALAGQGAATTTTSFDAGAAVVGQTGEQSVLAPTLGAEWQRAAVRTTLRASAAATIAGSDRWAVQGVGAGSWFAGPARAPRELGALGSVLRLLGVPAATSVSVLARQHVIAGDVGAWIGGAAGLTSRGGEGSGTSPMMALDGSVWRQGTRWRAAFTLSALATRLDSSLAPGTPVRSARYTALDAVGGVAWRHPALELAADVGVRRAAWRGDGREPRYAPIAIATAALPLRRSLALVVTAGDQFADPVRGTPAVRHLALALRMRPSARRPAAPVRPASVSPGLPSPATGEVNGSSAAATATSLEVLGDGRRRVVRVEAPPSAQSVELRSDATAWTSVALVKRGGRWQVALALAPGTHRVMIRVDGGPWVAPANLPAVDDDFGSRVGLLVVP